MISNILIQGRVMRNISFVLRQWDFSI